MLQPDRFRCEHSPRTLPVRLCLLIIGLVGGRDAPLAAEPPPPAAEPPIVILIGGNHSDPSPDQRHGRAGRAGNSGLWRLKGDLLEHQKLKADYFNWNGTLAGHIDDPHPAGATRIARRIRQRHAEHPQAPIVLVGNSWGGHTAWQVCRLLAGEPIDEQLGSQQSIDTTGGPRSPAATATSLDEASDAPAQQGERAIPPGILTVDLLVLLDPSSFGRGKEPMPTVLPKNVRRVINYHTRNTFGWQGWLDEQRLQNVDLGDPANGYLGTNGPRYDSALNWTAHVAAEWDERIHKDIRGQISAVVSATAEQETTPPSGLSSPPGAAGPARCPLSNPPASAPTQ